MHVRLTLNGRPVEVEAAGDALLVEVVRDLGLTGTKEVCGVGACGACTVVVDGDPVSACLALLGTVEGCEVWTVEGLAELDDGPVDAFERARATQCGSCTPGQAVAAWAHARAGGSAAPAEVRMAMAGNLCRCTGYRSILRAAEELADGS